MTVDSPGTHRRAPWVAVLLGIVLIVATILLVHGNTPPPTDAGTLPATAAASAPPAVPSTTAPAATSPAPQASSLPASSSSSSPARTTRSARTASVASPTTAVGTSTATATTAAAAAAPGRPAVLHLPTLNVTATVDPVDSTHGVLQVPDDISRVGWWQHSAAAGSAAGSTVLDGHIDSAVTGEGALFHLADLAPGDPVSLTTSTGATISYRVQARRVYVKEKGLPAELFSQQGPGRLVIISCGGTFDRSIRSYEENIAVFAVPVSS